MKPVQYVAGLFMGIALESTHAVVLIHEDFSSYANGDIAGQTAATVNLTGPWAASSDTFGDYEVQGGVLQFTRTSNAGSAGVPKFAAATVADNAATNESHTEFWASGVISTGTLRGAFFSVRLFDADGGGAEGAPFVNRLVFGLDGGNAFLATNVSDYTNGATSLSFTGRTNSSGTFDSGAHTLVVQLVNLGANDAYRLWVDPDMSGGIAGLGTPTVEITTGNMIYNTGSHLYDGVVATPNQVRANILTNVSENPQSGYLDDFILGTTFDDLLIPEPSGAAMGISGVLLVFLRRRRK